MQKLNEQQFKEEGATQFMHWLDKFCRERKYYADLDVCKDPKAVLALEDSGYVALWIRRVNQSDNVVHYLNSQLKYY